MTFANRIELFIDSENLPKPGSRIIVGLSGGADSVALLAVLCELGYSCVAVHCHFGLRGEEADRDLEHSKSIARDLGVSFHSVQFDTKAYMTEHKVSAEMACRDLRYKEFERIRMAEGADAIAVGHHVEDNIETLLLNLLRGCGIHGVKGILPQNGHIVRPLLEVTKEEIINYLKEQNLTWVEDSSNAEIDAKRNKLRLQVLPALRDAFPEANQMLCKSLRNLRGCEKLYKNLLPERTDSLDGVTPTLLHEWLAPFGFNSSQCYDIVNAAVGASFFSRTHFVTVRPGKKFTLQPAHIKSKEPKLNFRVYPRKDFHPEEGKLYLDYDKVGTLDGRWILRKWEDGDCIRPYGMKGSRMVSDILNERGIDPISRRQVWVLTLDDKILWVVGHRASAHFPVTKSTKNIIEIYEEI